MWRPEDPDMGIAVGPVEAMGHPFCSVTEVPLRREVGEHIAYAFGTKWLYSKLRIVPDEPVDAVVLWDPGWLRTGTGEGAIDEIRKVWEQAQEWDAPVVGLYSDWFAAWKVDTGISGTLSSTMFCDALIVDPAGAAALRASVHPLRVTDPNDHRYRPIVEMDSFLTYGRLPRIGGELDVEVPPIHEREVDVAMVSTLHPQHVVLRPYYVDSLRKICAENRWSFEFRNDATAEEMEELYLNSKVVANVSLGSQPNCRVSEALACGALLLTDGWNIGVRDVPCARFNDAFEMKVLLRDLLEMEPVHQDRVQLMGRAWARAHSPERTWKRVFDAALAVAPLTQSARGARNSLSIKRMEEALNVD
jgi:hypothetical protein